MSTTIALKDVRYIALSAGGFHVASHVGALERMSSLGYSRTFLRGIGGVSAGAVIATCVAANIPLASLLDAITRFDSVAFKRGLSIERLFVHYGLQSSDVLRRVLSDLLRGASYHPNVTFAALYRSTHVTLRIAATRFSDLELVTFDHVSTPGMPILDALVMSCSIPCIFPPVARGGELYMDGGLAMHTPLAMFADPESTLILRGATERKAVRMRNVFEFFASVFLGLHDALERLQLASTRARIIHVATLSHSLDWTIQPAERVVTGAMSVLRVWDPVLLDLIHAVCLAIALLITMHRAYADVSLPDADWEQPPRSRGAPPLLAAPSEPLLCNAPATTCESSASNLLIVGAVVNTLLGHLERPAPSAHRGANSSIIGDTCGF